MSKPLGPFVTALGDLAAQRAQSAEAPSVAELGAYARGELTGERADAVAEHLAWSREDADLVRDYEQLAEEPPEPLAAGELESAWQRFVGEVDLAKPSAPPADAPAKVLPFPPARFNKLPWSLALAASLVAALVGVWGLEWRQRALAPRVNTPTVELVAPEKLRSDVPTVSLSGAVRLVIKPTLTSVRDRLTLRIWNAREELVWEDQPRPVSDTEFFSVDLLPGFLPPGEYRLELHSELGGEPTTRWVRLAAAPSED